MKRLALSLIAVIAIAAAASADVAPELEENGYFIEDGSSADPSAVSNAVAEARFAGGKLSIAVLASEPGGGATVFAENTLDEMGGSGTVFVVGPDTVGWTSQDDIYTGEQLDEATDASLDGSSDTEVVELFVATLIGEPVGSTEPGGGGGLPWGWIFLIVIIGGGGFLFWRMKVSSKKREQEAIENARAEVKKRLDDVANDIIELEDEVATSDNDEVKDHYESATFAYAEALDDYEIATVPQELMTTAEELDAAIWHLDCADALLDGEPLPPKPEKPKLQAPPPAPAPSAPSGESPLTAPPRIPDAVYRRPQRRSSSGTGEVMMGMLLGAMANSRRTVVHTRGSGSSSRSSGSSRRSSGSSRTRGGGSRRR
ncbi:MAG: hypothetical protein ABFS21_06275 [Actinomycetota bacterium]